MSGDQRNGGAGFVIDFRDGDTVTGRVAAGRHASSFASELTAILAATRCLLQQPIPTTSDADHRPMALFCTDSKSALQALSSGPTTNAASLFADVWKLLSALSRHYRVTLQWVPAHCGIPGNEAADAQAANGSRLKQRHVQIAHSAALAAVRRSIRRNWLEGPLPAWYAQVTKNGGARTEELRRPDEVTVSQLRTGHSSLLGSYRHRIGLAPSPQCQDCDFDDADSAEHFLLNCPAHQRLRETVFGPGPYDPSLIFAQPSAVASFVRRAGRTRPRI